METTSSNTEIREDLILSVWPNYKHLLTIDPTCLAASLWLRSQGYSFSIANVNQQIPMIFGTYPTLFDVGHNKHYVGFDSIYDYSRKINPSADELSLLATFKRLFVPAFLHSQWLDETNKTSFRTLYHSTIGLPTSLFYIRKKYSTAQTWLNLIAQKCAYINEELDRIYTDADRCLKILENELIRNNEEFLGGEKFSLLDAWVSAYLLVLVQQATEKSRLRTLFIRHTRLVDYLKRIEENQLLFVKEQDSSSHLPPSKTENSIDIVSALHFLSQIVSFSIFCFMLTKIGANSYAITS